MKGNPWQPVPGQSGDELRPHLRIGEPTRGHEARGEAIDGRREEGIVRRARIDRALVQEKVPTIGRPGCRAVTRGMRAQGHSEACRERFEQYLREQDPDRLERARIRMGAPAQ